MLAYRLQLCLIKKQTTPNTMTSSHACQTGSASRTISVIDELPSDLAGQSEACAPETRAYYRSVYRAVQADVQREVSSGRTASSSTHWKKWVELTDKLGLDPLLDSTPSKIPILQIFLREVRSRALASTLDQPRITYGRLPRRSKQWGGQILGLQSTETSISDSNEC